LGRHRPLCLASLLTGLIESLGTPWGLVRHYCRLQLVVDSAAALFVLLVATVLAVYKPRGLTRAGWRRQYQGHGLRTDTSAGPGR
jgi:hypothetical protein